MCLSGRLKKCGGLPGSRTGRHVVDFGVVVPSRYQS